ncbi:MAG: GNAT family N-acetyltransferase [Candidatus Fermentibacteria bacterium]|nr:GNAT family N-acetyltransferase [Candidatus Fermentibacteria bacterium]
MPGRFEFRPFEEKNDLELVLGWLVETKRIIPDAEVDIAIKRKYYFEAVRQIQSRKKEFSSVLYLNNEPVGYLCTFPMPKQPENAWLDFCYLIPEVRGTEASDLIIDRTVQLASGGKCKAIFLNVHQQNHRAIAFYEKNGWQLREKKDNGLQKMKKTLNGTTK